MPGAVTTYGTQGHDQYRAQHLLHAISVEHERKSRPGEQLHARRHRHERDVQQPDRLQPGARIACRRSRILTANSPADYGNVNGGGVVSVLKSGTNQFHGSAYGYVQDYRLQRQLAGATITPIRSFRSIPSRSRSSAEHSAARSSVTSCSSLWITWVRAITQGGLDAGQRLHAGDARRRFLRLAERANGNPDPALRPAKTTSRPMSDNQGVPIVQSGGEISLLRIPSFTRCPTPLHGRHCARTICRARAAASRPTTRATSRSSTTRGPQTRSRASTRWAPATTVRPRCCHHFPRREYLSHQGDAARTGCTSFRLRS